MLLAADLRGYFGFGGSAGDTTFWIGHFQRVGDFKQARWGWERWHEISAGRVLTTV